MVGVDPQLVDPGAQRCRRTAIADLAAGAGDERDSAVGGAAIGRRGGGGEVGAGAGVGEAAFVEFVDRAENAAGAEIVGVVVGGREEPDVPLAEAIEH